MEKPMTLVQDLANGNTPLHISMNLPGPWAKTDDCTRAVMLLLKTDRRACIVENKKGLLPIEMFPYERSPLIWEALAVATMIAIGESMDGSLQSGITKKFEDILKEIVKLKREAILKWDLIAALKSLGMSENQGQDAQ